MVISSVRYRAQNETTSYPPPPLQCIYAMCLHIDLYLTQ